MSSIDLPFPNYVLEPDLGHLIYLYSRPGVGNLTTHG